MEGKCPPGLKIRSVLPEAPIPHQEIGDEVVRVMRHQPDSEPETYLLLKGIKLHPQSPSPRSPDEACLREFVEAPGTTRHHHQTR